MLKVAKKRSIVGVPTVQEDKAITAAAKADPDVKPLTSKQLKSMVPLPALRDHHIPKIIILLMLVGCSSTHNFKTDGHSVWGGGFVDEELQPGLYEMTATANFAPWPTFSAAIGTWKARADQLCGNDAYQEIVTTRDVGYRGDYLNQNPSQIRLLPPKFNTTMSGYILCNSSSMTRADAVKYIEELPAIRAKEFALERKNEFAELGGENCAINNGDDSAETYYRRGKILMDLNEYQPAMSCFLQAQEREQSTNVYRESCTAIGMMYELGWGVEKDIPMAMSWYKKAGL